MLWHSGGLHCGDVALQVCRVVAITGGVSID